MSNSTKTVTNFLRCDSTKYAGTSILTAQSLYSHYFCITKPPNLTGYIPSSDPTVIHLEYSIQFQPPHVHKLQENSVNPCSEQCISIIFFKNLHYFTFLNLNCKAHGFFHPNSRFEDFLLCFLHLVSLYSAYDSCHQFHRSDFETWLRSRSY